MAMEYFDSMVKNDEFLVHLGNAMRGSCLAGKPYPGTEPPEQEDAVTTADDRIDEVLHALHKLQGDVSDLKMAVEDLAASKPAPEAAQPVNATAPQGEGMPATQAPADGDRGEG